MGPRQTRRWLRDARAAATHDLVRRSRKRSGCLGGSGCMLGIGRTRVHSGCGWGIFAGYGDWLGLAYAAVDPALNGNSATLAKQQPECGVTTTWEGTANKRIRIPPFEWQRRRRSAEQVCNDTIEAGPRVTVVPLAPIAIPSVNETPVDTTARTW